MLKKIVWDTRLLLNGSSLRYLAQLKKAERLSNDRISALQKERLKKLLIHASDHTPYYRSILSKAGVVKEGRFLGLDSFGNIPLLTKDIIRKEFKGLTSDDIDKRRWYENTSGGSTGEPVCFIQDRDYDEWLWASAMLCDCWSGYSRGGRKIVLWGSERDILMGREKLKTRIGRWVRNQIWLNAFRMTHEQMSSYVKVINKTKPVQILAYVNSIYEFSKFIKQNSLSIYSPKAVMTSASALCPHMRETIESIFKTKIFDRYGSREVGNIACECEAHSGLHVFPLTHYVEILNKDGVAAEPGEAGEIVITLLTNYAMPLIRYRIGDMGVWTQERCHCGREWPILKEVTGRVSDIFLKKDGTQIYGGYFTQLFYFQNWVKKFQVMQEDYDDIRLIIVPQDFIPNLNERYSMQLGEIVKKIKVIMGENCKVRCEFVTDISSAASGKYRYTISKITR